MARNEDSSGRGSTSGAAQRRLSVMKVGSALSIIVFAALVWRARCVSDGDRVTNLSFTINERCGVEWFPTFTRIDGTRRLRYYCTQDGLVHFVESRVGNDTDGSIERTFDLGFPIAYDAEFGEAHGRVVIVAVVAESSGGPSGLSVAVDTDRDGFPDSSTLIPDSWGRRFERSSVIEFDGRQGTGWMILEHLEHKIWSLKDRDNDGVPDHLGAVYADTDLTPHLEFACSFEFDHASSRCLRILSNRKYQDVDALGDWFVMIRDTDGDGIADSVGERIRPN